MKDKYGKDIYEKWGTKGGKVKTKKGTAMLTPEQRKIRATEAVNARWAKVKQEKKSNVPRVP